MARRYAVNFNDTAANNTTLGGVTSTAAIQPRIYDLMIGSRATPADQASGYQVQRYTAAGTSTAVTPQKLLPSDPAATTTAGENHSVEPTYTAGEILLEIDLNQRATFRWVAVPGGEIVLPSTAANGAGILFLSPTAAYAVDATVHFEE